jgi:hypothetical protein
VLFARVRGVRNPTRIHTLLAGALLLALSCCTAAAEGDVAGEAAQPLRGEGEPCGAFSGRGCDDGLACFYAPGTCGKDERGGVCGPRPEICTFLYAPVCGCDGRTYPNHCDASRAGVSIVHRGACGSGEGEPAITGSPM